ncbi:hypothetical protein BH11PLA2_BH11PLA2_18100 [soil metagenome]
MNGGKGTVSWRLKTDKDFPSGQSVTFDWPAGEDWKDAKIDLPTKSNLVHIRITIPANADTARLQSLGLIANDGSKREFQFDLQK